MRSCVALPSLASLGSAVATIDLDATIIRLFKKECEPTYHAATGNVPDERGDQPLIAVCPKIGMVLHAEMRTAVNIPVLKGNLEALEAAPSRLPESVVSDTSGGRRVERSGGGRNRLRPKHVGAAEGGACDAHCRHPPGACGRTGNGVWTTSPPQACCRPTGCAATSPTSQRRKWPIAVPTTSGGQSANQKGGDRPNPRKQRKNRLDCKL